MKKRNQILTISIALFLSSSLFGQTKSDSLLNAYLEKSKVAGVVAGYMSNDNEWTSAVGYKSLDNDELLITTTKIRIASIAKTMTAVAIMQLVEKGMINMDTPIDSYFDKASSLHSKITVRQLLHHSSGIRAYESSKERQNKIEYENLEGAYSIFKDDPLEIDPGSTFSYTSYGYVVLGIIIEQVSELSYEDYMTQNIWRPLGMNNTGVERFDMIDQTFSQLYHKSSNGKVRKAKRRTNLSDRIPGGGLYSTAGDILLFGKGLLDGKLINKELFNEMMSDSGLKKEGNPYGYGLFLYGENPNYGNVVGHGGAQIGASAQLMLLSDQNAVIFTASNTSGVWEDMVYLSVQLFSEASK